MASTNIINAVFGSGLCAVTTSAFRANYGMVLRFSGVDLPTAFEVDFSNYDVAGRDSITAIGQNGEVQIPDQLWDSGLNIYAFVYLHPTDDSGVTVYTVTIPVLGRPNRTDETPTPHEQSVIEQAISALNDAVEQTAADVVAADASASAAAQSEANASVSERSAAASASAALASQNAAHASETASEQSAQSASGSADQASQSAQASAESADTAQGAAASAERSEQNASASAASAQSKANEAASSAATASGKANEASASATAAAQSASSAASAAQNAAESATSAESSATDAATAKADAQDAQAAAEQAAESISDKAAQIEQNTADIADLVQTKAGALIDTASGSIASFVPDSTIPTVKGLSVDIEPVQDLHGYDNPWPAGGGKNLAKITAETIVKPDWYTGGWDGTTMNSNGGITQTRTYQQGGAGGFALELPEGAYMFSMEFTGTTPNCMLYVSSWDGTTMTTILANERMNNNGNRYYLGFTVPSGSIQLVARPTIWSGNLTYDLNKIQIESGSTATTYAPYSNICPISGWDAVEVKHSGADMTNPTTYQIQLGQTVYGGTVDAVKGVLTVDRAMVDLGTRSWSKQNESGFWTFYTTAIFRDAKNTAVICSEYKYKGNNNHASLNEGEVCWFNTTDLQVTVRDTRYQDAATFKTAMSGVQLVYKLATPITIQLDPVAVSIISGQTNNIWADSGNVSVEYAADLKTYIDQKIAAAVAALS